VTQLHLKAHKTRAVFQLINKPQIKCKSNWQNQMWAQSAL